MSDDYEMRLDGPLGEDVPRPRKENSQEDRVIGVERVTAYKVGGKLYTDYDEAVRFFKDRQFTELVNNFLASSAWRNGAKMVTRRALYDFAAYMVDNGYELNKKTINDTKKSGVPF